MSQLSRVTTWASLQTLTAAALNGEFNNIINGWNNHDSGTSRWTVTDSSSFKYAGNAFPPVLQVIQATSTTSKTTTSATFVDTNLTASITPKSTSSRVMVWAASCVQSSAADVAIATLARGGANLLASAGEFRVSSGGIQVPASLLFLDSPASTSALAYSVQLRNTGGAQNVQWGETNVTQAIILVELGL